MPRAVSRAEVLEWLAANEGAPPADAVAHFWPSATGPERVRHLGAIRQWLHRARAGSVAAPPELAAPLRPAPGRPIGGEARPGPTDDELPNWSPDTSVVSDSLIADLEATAARLAGDARCLRRIRRWDQASRIESAILDVRQQIESARKAAASRVRVERTPAAIAIELERHRRTIELAAEQARRKAARDTATRDRQL